MSTAYYRRAPAFASLAELLQWSERQGSKVPVVYEGPDGSQRGSVEVDAGGELFENIEGLEP